MKVRYILLYQIVVKHTFYVFLFLENVRMPSTAYNCTATRTILSEQIWYCCWPRTVFFLLFSVCVEFHVLPVKYRYRSLPVPFVKLLCSTSICRMKERKKTTGMVIRTYVQMLINFFSCKLNGRRHNRIAGFSLSQYWYKYWYRVVRYGTVAE